MTTFDDLAESYDLGRIGYSNDVYGALEAWGFRTGTRVLDIGCGTGLSSAHLIASGYAVTGLDISEPMLALAQQHFPNATWMQGSAESLPFDDASFDGVVGAQTFHHVDRVRALREVARVLRPNGVAAFWWKVLSIENVARQTADAVARELGYEPPPRGGASGGFREFYGSGWSETALRVIPWVTALPLTRFVQYERSRKIVHETFADRSDAYIDLLESRLAERLGDRASFIPLQFTQFLYLARR